MTENNGLPQGWVWVELSDVADIFSGIGFPKIYQGNTEGEIPFFKVGDISRTVQNGETYLRFADNYVSQEVCNELKGKLLPPKTIVFAKIGEAIKLNRRAILAQKSLVDNNVMGVHSSSEHLDGSYLYYFWLTIKLGDLSRATTVPSVRKSDVQQIRLPLAPRPEQERIVAKIEELFTQLEAGVAELQQAKAQFQRYRQAVLKSAVEGELTREWRAAHQSKLEPAEELLARILSERRAQWEAEQWEKEIARAQKRAAQAKLKATGRPSRINDLKSEEWEKLAEDEFSLHLPKNDKWKEKYKEPELPDTDDLARLPEGWIWVSVEQASDKIVDCLHSTPKFADEGFFCVDTNWIKPGRLVFERARYVDEDTFIDRNRRMTPKAGDVLFSREGALLGIAVQVPENIEICLGQRMMVFRLGDGIESTFFETVLNSPVFRSQYTKEITGTASPHLNIRDIRLFGIPLPPNEEQLRIVDMVERRLSVADEIEKELDQALARSERLRQSILKRAFEGKLV